MVQDALLVALVGMAVFFLLIPASIWLLKSALRVEEPAEPVEEEIETNEQSGRSEPPRQGSSA
ncbi:hypothetical protein [Halorientalis pallida]|jgi:hypothetical protein|uniref:Uncharacterized protein n=1 Tax=Halorientalis pallida TaxID=2479928 RepID=A0A498L1Y2_9EURY|nr:hypothetical protein [Halorientalis pallida]RXK51301.1 hypothetical protein EAF64_01270 [Halorientalis pallida]